MVPLAHDLIWLMVDGAARVVYRESFRKGPCKREWWSKSNWKAFEKNQNESFSTKKEKDIALAAFYLRVVQDLDKYTLGHH
jgi:hypothetical protein